MELAQLLTAELVRLLPYLCTSHESLTFSYKYSMFISKRLILACQPSFPSESGGNDILMRLQQMYVQRLFVRLVNNELVEYMFCDRNRFQY